MLVFGGVIWQSMTEYSKLTGLWQISLQNVPLSCHSKYTHYWLLITFMQRGKWEMHDQMARKNSKVESFCEYPNKDICLYIPPKNLQNNWEITCDFLSQSLGPQPSGQEVKVERREIKFGHVRFYLGVSKNNGTPKSSFLIGLYIINHPFWGTPILFFSPCLGWKSLLLRPILADDHCNSWLPSWELTYPLTRIFEDDFPFPRGDMVGYVSSLEGNLFH